jgi:pseudaminic acid synthase
MSFRLANINIGSGNPPFIIAEMSGNHNQSLDRALAIVDAAAKSGAHALKIQTYTADTMTIEVNKGDFLVSAPDSLWQGNSLYKLYQQAYTPWEWHKPILERCHQLGIIGFSTPFDDSAVDFLEELKVPCYKIASFENIDLALIRKVASTKKPLIISTGLASVAEISEAVSCAREAGCQDLALLKCTSAYPASAKDANILTIPHMKSLFDCEVGLSDHTDGIGVAVASIALGGCLVEKHFTLNRNDGGVDSAFSIEPDELFNLVKECKRAWEALGTVSYSISASEKNSVTFRRSLYIVRNLNAGERLSHENLRSIRPGYGLAPKYLDVLIGKRINKDIMQGTPMSWDLLM